MNFKLSIEKIKYPPFTTGRAAGGFCVSPWGEYLIVGEKIDANFIV